jgi:phenol 2-monooxygenase
VDVENPFILLVHQGIVEDVFIEDLMARNLEVSRGLTFEEYHSGIDSDIIEVAYIENKTGSHHSIKTKYLIGCDGAHSNVRKCIPGAKMVGESSNAQWGVLDGKYFVTLRFLSPRS